MGSVGGGGESSEGRPSFYLSVCPSSCQGQHPCAQARERASVKCAAGSPCAQARGGRLGILARAAGTQARGRAGVQWCGWCEGANPGRQIQRKEPSVLTQRALMQSGAAARASSHSLMSGEGEYKEQGGQLRAGDPGAHRPVP